METTITTRRAGKLTFDTFEGYAGDVTFHTDHGPVQVWVHIFENASADDTLLGRVSGVLDAFPELLQTGRGALESDIANGGQALPFVEFHTEELPRPDLGSFLQKFGTGKISAKQLITQFTPPAFVVMRDDSNQVACWIDFILPPFESDQVLTVTFMPDRTVRSLSWES